MKCFITIFCVLIFFLTSTFTASFAQTLWTKDTTNNPVLEPGLPGAWDELYVQHSSVVFDGNEYHMWYCAKSAITNDWAIGHATSQDGIFWVKDSLNPVLTMGSAGSWDDDDVFSPSVLYDGSIFHMWYCGSDGNNYRIGYANSPDGTNWTKYAGNPVLGLGSAGSWDSYGVEAPAVILEGNSYTMWYRGYTYSYVNGIGRATSTDGINWIKDTQNNPVLTPGPPLSWEKDFLRLGSVVFDGTTYHLFYYAGDFYMDFRIGYAWSSDGFNWTKYDDPGTTNLSFAQSDPVLTWGQAGSWDDIIVMSPWVILDSLTSTFRMWYAGADDLTQPVTGIGFATAPITGLEEVESERYPEGFALNQNYPNPFNPETIIEFSIPKSEFVTLKIYNLLGQEVSTLVSEKLNAGNYTYSWDAGTLASGVYLYKLSADNFSQTRKMILLR